MRIQPFSSIKAGMQYRPYFFVSFLMTLLLYSALQFFTAWAWSTCLLISWNLAVSAYLIFTMTRLWHTDHSRILQRAQQQDASKWLILVLVFLTLVMCFIAIVVEVNHLPPDSAIRLAHLALSVITILCAWLFMHTVFALHYAHDFYLALAESQDGGLDFPKTPLPAYPDFLYFSYVIGTSAQTADVAITSRPMRVLNMLHILLAYAFNTTILAVCINVAAGFIQP